MSDSGDRATVSCPAHYEGEGFSMADCPACAPPEEMCQCFCWCTSYSHQWFYLCFNCIRYCMFDGGI